MSRKPRAQTHGDRDLVGKQVVGDLAFEAGRIVLVRVDDNAESSDRPCKANGAETEVGRFSVEGSAYCVMMCRADPFAMAPGDANEDLTITLTVRELQIAALLSRGQLNKQIASHLHISEHTVSTYLSRIFSKMGVHSRSAVAARYAAWRSRAAGSPT